MPASQRPDASGEEAAEQILVLLIVALILLALFVVVLTVQGGFRDDLTAEQWQVIVRRK